jgi:type I restriction enzyme S subunit
LGTVTNYGRTVKVEPADIPGDAWVLELEDIEKDSSRILQRLTQSQRQSLSTKNRFDAGDVLYGKLRPYLNKVVIADGPGFCTTEIVPVQAGPAVERRYLFHWLKHPAFLKYVEAASHGMNMPRLGTDAGRTAPVVLAPRPEQIRIADQLDTLLARIQACQDRLEAIPALLKRFRDAVLASATTGELTAEWRATQRPALSAAELRRLLDADHVEAGGHLRGNASEPTEEAHDLSIEQMPDGWVISTLRDCCRPGRPITYGILKPGPELEEGVPYVRVADFPGNQLNLNSIKRTSPDIDLQYKRARLSTGDLLLSIRGSVGRLIVIPSSLEGANITQDTARLSISSRLNARYVYYALLSPDAQRRMTNATRGVAVRGINIGDVRALQVPLPSLPEQNEIVRRIDALFEVAGQIESRHDTALRQVDRLTSLTLTKAFRAELVPQDPNDEPASALLARIAAQRNAPADVTAAPTRRRGRPPRAAKETATMTKSRQDDDVMGRPYLAGHLRRIGTPASAEALFKAAELPVADFYKQLAWEVDQGHVKDNQTTLEPGHAAG